MEGVRRVFKAGRLLALYGVALEGGQTLGEP